jgi:hypothetical protein
MKIMVLDIEATHENIPNCKKRLAQDPKGNWYCVDCGFRIFWKEIRVAPTVDQNQHAIEALREMAKRPCNKSNCGSVCLCGPCHARRALEDLDPEWRP